MATETVSSDTLDLKLLLKVLKEVKSGNFTVRMPIDKTGIAGKIADTLNEIIDLNETIGKEIEQVSQKVGKEGKVKERIAVKDVKGYWKTNVDSINKLVEDLVQSMIEISRVIGAVSKGALDVFFESVAYSYGKSAVGILLTGHSRDGVQGICKIKGKGGLTIAQEPSTAEAPMMPESALDSGCIDKLLNLHGISQFLLEIY